MKYDRIVIRYGEMSTKGKNRSLFVRYLKQNIVYALKKFKEVTIQSSRDRMYVMLNGEDETEIMNRLKNIFGIQSFSLSVRTEKNLEEIQEASLQLVKKHYKDGNTFKVTTRRADKSFKYDTNEMNHLVGSFVLKNIDNLTVNVKQPDMNLTVDIRSDGVYLSIGAELGAGGLPVGASGKSLLMLSGGIDSPVAGYLTMKRGVQLEVIHFQSPPYTSPRAKQKTIDLARQIANYSGKVRMHFISFTKIQEKLRDSIPSGYMMTATRRMMLRIADEIRRKNGAMGIVTGESLGQVASQTLESMVAINAVTSTPILRPLISTDKVDIIKIAKQINTYDISKLPYEDCCTIFTPPAPKTRPKLDKMEFYESTVDFEALFQEAIKTVETMDVFRDEVTEEETMDLF